MDGIHFLNTEEILAPPEWTTTVGLVCIAFTVIFLVLTIGNYTDGHKIPATVFGILCILSVMSGIGTTFINECVEKPTGRYRYEVTLDDSVTFEYIYDHYKIIEQRGDIWVLEDKEDSDE